MKARAIALVAVAMVRGGEDQRDFDDYEFDGATGFIGDRYHDARSALAG